MRLRWAIGLPGPFYLSGPVGRSPEARRKAASRRRAIQARRQAKTPWLVRQGLTRPQYRLVCWTMIAVTVFLMAHAR